ncbi:MAG: anti-sigma factor domain-containing protein [Candidatus Dormibacteria bacterium]
MSIPNSGGPPMVRRGCTDGRDLLGAFVLDSLGPTEEAQVRQHLKGCSACRAEADELRAVAAQIGADVDEVEPPSGLRGRILAQARAERAHLLPDLMASTPDAPARGWVGRRWSPWIATAAAAVVALSAGGWALAEHFSHPVRQPGLTSVQLNPLDRLIASGNSTVIPLSPTRNSAAQGALVTDPRTGTTYLLLTGVARLQAGKAYTLWYMAPQNGSLTPVRIGEVTHPGAYRIGRSPTGFTEVALTREPSAGDRTPRGPVLLSAALS